MDDRCKETLRLMKLPHLIKTFEEHRIDYETLKLFHEYPDTIQSIVPSVGDGLKLRQGLKLICEAHDAQDAQYSSESYEGVSYYEPRTPLAPDASSGATRALPPSGPPVMPPVNVAEVAILAIETSDGKRMRVDPGIAHGGATDPASHVLVAEHETVIALSENPHFEFSKNYIQEVLERTAIGKAILQQHKLSMMDNSTRCKLAELVIQGEYGANTDTTIDSKRFTQLATWTAECLPGELVDTYYIPSRERGQGRSPSGKFYDAYTNLNKELRRVNLRKARINPGARRAKPSLYSSASLPQEAESAENVHMQISLDFLESHLKPWEELKECWKRTSSCRLRLLREGRFPDLTGARYINKYPILKQPRGYLLLEHDFQVLFKEAENNWTECWPEFSAKLRRELLICGVKEESLDCDAALLYNYPKLFTVVPVRMPNQKPWRASRMDIQEGFLVHIKMVGDYENALENTKKTLEAKGLELYPFPLIVGEDLSTITSSYVVIDGIPLRVESPLRAMEVVFKSYHALNCQYPPQSVRLWTVIAKAVFGIEEQWIKGIESTPEVKRLISLLKCTDLHVQSDQSGAE